MTALCRRKIMTDDERVAMDRLKRSHDELVIQTLALTAVIGAMVEKAPPAQLDVHKWCLALSRLVPGLPPARVQTRADAILRPKQNAEERAA
jgi:hypothetical protein